MSGTSDIIIRASAGTGKTFQLSNRFIGLAAQQPLDGILATTFTRKAAGEILDRVLVRVAEAALVPEKLADLARHVGGPPLDCGRCLGLLGNMVRHLHRLRISTLDSFFVEIAQSFGLEMGLPPGWAIAEEMDDEAIRMDAIRTMLEKAETWDVAGLMYRLTKGDAARRVSEQIAELVKGLYAIYCEAPADAWKSLPRQKPLDEAELQAAVSALENATFPPGVRYQKTHAQDLGSAVAGDWESLLGKGLGAKVFDGSEQFYGRPIPRALLTVYRPLVNHAKAVLLGQIVDQTEATWDLLQRFDAEYQRLKASRRAFRFEDVTRRLGETTLGVRLEEVVYRLDGQVTQILLDEFQDTSAPQWRVLRPFAQRVVGGGAERSLFCVGDVKQAIYGWRGGVAEIFDAVDDEFGPLPSRALNQSFRSSQVVIDCVNSIFTGIAGNPVLQKCAAAAEKWSQRFSKHTTAKDLPGYCRLVAAPAAAEGEDQWAVTLDYAAEEVLRLHQQSPEHEIGVLVRRNKAVARLIFELRRRGLDASEEGGNPLTDSPAVEIVLSLLTLADHPGDTAARYHVAHSPLGEHVGLTKHDDSPATWQLAETTRRRLMIEGYSSVVEGWARELAPFCDRRDVSRLEQLVETARGYESRATIRPADFMRLVQQKKVEDPTSAKVRVMTIHQAKGLQFDIVVLPELDQRMSGQPPEIVAGSPAPAAQVDRVCRYVGKDLRGILPDEFKKMHDTYEELVVEESLCLLYVAVTRAVHSLHMAISPPKETERTIPCTFAGVLRAALAGDATIAPNKPLYEHGDPRWFEHIKPKGADESVRRAAGSTANGRADFSPPSGCKTEPGGPSYPIPPIWPQRPERPTRGLEHSSPSGLEGGGLVHLARQLRLDMGQARDRGTLLHAWFEQIGWLEDGEPTDAELERIACEKKLDHLDLPGLICRFRESLRKPVVAAALRLATYRRPAGSDIACRVHAPADVNEPHWEVLRERSFAVADDGGILQGAFDRLVVVRDGSRVVGADILDYKTDEVGDDLRAFEARVEQYRPQLDAYRRAAARMLAIPESLVSARLLFVGLGVIRAV